MRQQGFLTCSSVWIRRDSVTRRISAIKYVDDGGHQLPHVIDSDLRQPKTDEGSRDDDTFADTCLRTWAEPANGLDRVSVLRHVDARSAVGRASVPWVQRLACLQWCRGD